MRSAPNQPPMLGPELPVYPWLAHVVRIFSPPITLGLDAIEIQGVSTTALSPVATTLEGFDTSDIGALLIGLPWSYGGVIDSLTADTPPQAHLLTGAEISGTNQPLLKVKDYTFTTGTGILASGTTDVTSTSPTFTDNMVGSFISGDGVPLGTLLTKVNSSTDATMSQPATIDMGQRVAITSGTIPTNLFMGYIQQWQPNLTLRDRELCFLWEPNGANLKPGYYDGRLVGSYALCPLIVTWCCPIGG